MSFQKIDAELRKEWLEHPVTRRFFDLLLEQERTLTDSLVYASMSTAGDLNVTMRIIGGQLNGFREARRLAGDEK